MAEEIEASLTLDIDAALKAIDDIQAGLELAIEAGTKDGVSLLSGEFSSALDVIASQLETAAQNVATATGVSIDTIAQDAASSLSDTLGTSVDEVGTSLEGAVSAALGGAGEVLDASLNAAAGQAGNALQESLDAALAGVTAEPIEVPVQVDAEQATEQVTQVGAASAQSASQLELVTLASNRLQNVVGGLPGPLGKVVQGIASLGPAGAAAAAALGVIGVVGYKYVGAAIESRAAAERLNAVFGDQARILDRIKIGDTTESFEQFAAALGSADEPAQVALASFGRLAIGAGATRAEAAKLSVELTRLATKGIESGKFTDLGAAIEALSGAMVRGSKGLRDFGISLSAAQISEEAVRLTGKAANELTAYDKMLGGLSLSQKKYGASLDESILRTRQFTDVLSRAAEQQKAIAEERAGDSLVDGFLEAKKRVDEFLASLTKLAGELFRALMPAVSGFAVVLGAVGVVLGVVADAIGFVLDSPLAPFISLAVGGFIAINAAMNVAAAGAVVFGSAATVAWSQVLGPLALVVVGVSLVAAAFSAFGDDAEDAAERTARVATAMTGLQATYRDLASGALSAAEAQKQVAQALADIVKEVFEAGAGKGAEEAKRKYAEFGVTVKTVQDAVLGSAPAYATLTRVLADQTAELERLIAARNRETDSAARLDLNRQIAQQEKLVAGTKNLIAETDKSVESLRKQTIAAIETSKTDGLITAAQAKRLRASSDLKKGTLDLIAAQEALSTAEKKRAADLAETRRASVDTAEAMSELVVALNAGEVDDTWLTDFAAKIGQTDEQVKAAVEGLQSAFDGLAQGFADSLPTVDDAITVGKDALEQKLQDYVATFSTASDAAKAEAEGNAQKLRDALTGWIDPQATIDALAKQTEAIAGFVPNIQALLDQGLTALASEAANRGPAFAAEFTSGLVPQNIKEELNAKLEAQKLTAEEAQAAFSKLIPQLGADAIAGAATALGLPLSEAFGQAITQGVAGAEAKARELGVTLPEGIAAGAKASEAASKAAIDATIRNVVAQQDAVTEGLDVLAVIVEADTSLGAAFRRMVDWSILQFADEMQRFGPAALDAINAQQGALDDGAETAGRSVGSAFGVGLTRGIESQESKITAAARKVAKAAEQAAKDALGIRSPSRVAAEIGDQFGAGMVIGLDGKSRAVADAAASLASVGDLANSLPRSSPLPSIQHVMNADPALLRAVDALTVQIGKMEAGSKTVNVDARGQTVVARKISRSVVESIR